MTKLLNAADTELPSQEEQDEAEYQFLQILRNKYRDEFEKADFIRGSRIQREIKKLDKELRAYELKRQL